MSSKKQSNFLSLLQLLFQEFSMLSHSWTLKMASHLFLGVLSCIYFIYHTCKVISIFSNHTGNTEGDRVPQNMGSIIMTMFSELTYSHMTIWIYWKCYAWYSLSLFKVYLHPSELKLVFFLKKVLLCLYYSLLNRSLFIYDITYVFFPKWAILPPPPPKYW